MGATINTESRIAKLERILVNDLSLSGFERSDVFKSMMYITQVKLGSMEAKPAEWCERMYELEKKYGLYESRKINNSIK